MTCEDIEVKGTQGFGLKFKQLNSKAGKLLNHMTLITSDNDVIEIGAEVDQEGEVLQHLFDTEDRFGGFVSDSIFHKQDGTILYTVSTLTYN